MSEVNSFDDVICSANLQAFKQRIQQLKLLIEDDNTLEQSVVDLCVKMLVEHGKSREMIRQISQISRILAESLGLGKSYCDRLEQAARIYDIGNLLVCSDIYLKEDALDFEEFKIVQKHTIWGYNLLIGLGFATTDLGAVISAEHHEWYNGRGYPNGTKGEGIDIAARIVSVADTVAALSTDRPGKKAWDHGRILDYVQAEKGGEFDPSVVDVLMINRGIILDVLHADLAEATEKWYA
jgi:HD-GYP domain-containing protein (c-di-GMP phosphodiesterase class II)